MLLKTKTILRFKKGINVLIITLWLSMLCLTSVHYAMESVPGSIKTLFKLFHQDPLDEKLAITLIKQCENQEDLFTYGDHHQNTLLHKAIERGSYSIAQALLAINSRKKIINNCNMFGFCPLRIAISKNFNTLVQLLIEHNIDIENIQFTYIQFAYKGLTPIGYALLHNNFVAARLLIQAGSPFPSALDAAFSPNDSKNIAKQLLLDGVSDPDLVNKLEPLNPLTRTIVKGPALDPFSVDNDPSESFDKLIEQSILNPQKNVLALMYAFAQRKSILLKQLLVSKKYRDCLLIHSSNNKTLVDLIQTLLDPERIRSFTEKILYLPAWQQEAALVGKIISTWILLLHKRLETTLHIKIPKDIQLLIIFFVLGESLFALTQTKKI